MTKKFNAAGLCIPEYHYMVDISERLEEIKELIDEGEYFTINRARQFGKTTTLNELKNKLDKDYCVFLISFEGIEEEAFQNTEVFCTRFFGLLYDTIEFGEVTNVPETVGQRLYELSQEGMKSNFRTLANIISGLCQEIDRPLILMIDEVDQASNNKVFVTFLGILRDMYLKRRQRPTFQSVILASVYDIKNLKSKIRAKDEHMANSPWNISSDFHVDMSLSEKGIAGMLVNYESDYDTGMDIDEMAGLLYKYTSGYPFLVSRICKLIDEIIAGSEGFPDRTRAWTKEGFLSAVRLVLTEQNTLFESLIGKLEEFPSLNMMIYSLLFTGKSIIYNPDNKVIAMAGMFGFIKNQDGNVAIANRIFETRLYNHYLSEEKMQESDIYKASVEDRNQFITEGHLNMRLILERFVIHFNELFPDADNDFLEEDGRKYFLLYLRPIINGRGNYYIESRTRDMKRTDIIVDYYGEQYIIEMKIWRGDEYNKRGEKQLAGYLKDYNQKVGYLLSFNFNRSKTIGVKQVTVGDKVIIEAVV